MHKLTAAVEADPDGGLRLALYVGKKLVARSSSYREKENPEKIRAFYKSSELINKAAVGELEPAKP